MTSPDPPVLLESSAACTVHVVCIYIMYSMGIIICAGKDMCMYMYRYTHVHVCVMYSVPGYKLLLHIHLEIHVPTDVHLCVHVCV